MTGYILVKYLHFLSILALFAALVTMHLLIRDRVDAPLMKRLVTLDRIYGIGLAAALVFGLVLVFGVGTPALFYAKNWVFHLKFGLFFVVAVAWLPQLRFLLKNRRLADGEPIDVPRYIVMLMRVQLLLLVVMPLLGSLMANGIGVFE